MDLSSGVAFLNWFKERAEFRKAGTILPRRILKCSNRRQQHKVILICDLYCIPTKSGYLLAADCRNSGVLIINTRSCHLQGSPYNAGGGTTWIGNHGMADEQWGNNLMKWYISMNKLPMPVVV